jgi:hypothetical protein
MQRRSADGAISTFQFRTELLALTPRVACEECGVHPVVVPADAPRQRFYPPVRSRGWAMAARMPIAVPRLVDEYDTWFWRVADGHVREARGRCAITAYARSGLMRRRVAAARLHYPVRGPRSQPAVVRHARRPDAHAIERFRDDFAARWRPAQATRRKSGAIWPPVLKGLAAASPGVPIAFDRLDLVQLLNQAVDRTRRGPSATSVRTGAKPSKGDAIPFSATPTRSMVSSSAISRRSQTLKTVRAFT